MNLGRVWGGFWEIFQRVSGGRWRLLGASWTTFWHHFLVLVFGMLSGRALGTPGLDFDSVLKGSGRVWEGFWRSNFVFFRFRTSPSLRWFKIA